MKRTILKLLAVCMALLVSVGSTIAYLTDTDSDVNVMTLGHVEIKLIEQERDDDGSLIKFWNDHPMIPGVYPEDAVTGKEVGLWPDAVKNAVDKIVSVTNIGKSAAYVRLWFAFEVTNDDEFFTNKLHLNRNTTDWQWEILKEKDDSYTYLSLDGSRYVVAVATYPEELAVGATTPVSLRQVLLASGVTNEELAVLGEKYSIFVVAQGIQAAGFDDAVTALNAGFNVPSAATHPFDHMDEKDAAMMVDEKNLRRALNENVPNGGGKTAVRSVAFGRMSEYVKDVEKLSGSSLGTTPATQNIGMMLFSHAFAEGEDVPLVYYKPVENEDGTQYYDVYILYEGTIKLPNNCEGLLAHYTNLNSFTTTNLDANEVENMEDFFKGCTNLTKVTVPKGVTEIDDSMFAECDSLEKVSIPGTVEKINANAFQEKKKDILFIVVEKSPAEDWVEDEDLPSTVVPEAPQKPDIPFTWRNDGISITITGYTGKELTAVIPAEIEGLPVTTIGAKAMDADDRITTVVLPDTVTHIDYAAFVECDSLAAITIPKNVISIDNNPFAGCVSLTRIDVDQDNPVYCSKDGVLFSRDMEKLMAYPAGKSGDYAVPEGVKIIGEMAFSGCAQLTSIDIPDSVTVIKTHAFAECTQLGSVQLPLKMDKIESFAFRACTSLTSVHMPKEVETLGDSLFYLCNHMTAMVYTDSDSHVWCKQNKVGYKLLDGASDHECVMVPNGYQQLDKVYHQQVFMCFGCFTRHLVKEPHTFTNGTKCACGTIDPNHACVFKPLQNYQIVDAVQHRYDIFCTICNAASPVYEKHTYNSNGTCVCGAVNPGSGSTHACKFLPTDEYVPGDADQHKRVTRCNGCGAVDYLTEAHAFGTDGTCACGAVKPGSGSAHTCKFMPTDKCLPGNADLHKRLAICNSCGAENYLPEAHTFDKEGKCACGETAPTTSTPDVTSD